MRLFVVLLPVTLASALACAKALAPPKVYALRMSAFQRGVGLGLFASVADYDYGHLLDEIVEHGATDVLLVVAWYQRDVGAHDIRPRRGSSPSDETVLRTLRQAKARGLRAGLLPIVRLEVRRPHEWRGRIAPREGVDTWFSHYGAYVLRMARLAEEGGADRFGVGSELLSLERHDERWRALIAEVRKVYGGKLFYSANWDHFEPIRFWDALDEVGVTAYFELVRSDERPTREALVKAWTWPRMELARLRRRLGKPLLITEVGYPSKVTAARYPWDETRRAPLDLALQADLYAAFCEAFQGTGVVDGVYFWNWFGFGGPSDGDYTPRGKPAARVMKACLKSNGWDAAPTGP